MAASRADTWHVRQAQGAEGSKRVWGADGRGASAGRGLLPGGWSQAWPMRGVEPYRRSNGPHPSTCRTRTEGRWGSLFRRGARGLSGPQGSGHLMCPGEWLAMRPSPHSAPAGAGRPPGDTCHWLRVTQSPASITQGEASPPLGTRNVRRARHWPYRPAPGKAGTRTPQDSRGFPVCC